MSRPCPQPSLPSSLCGGTHGRRRALEPPQLHVSYRTVGRSSRPNCPVCRSRASAQTFHLLSNPMIYCTYCMYPFNDLERASESTSQKMTQRQFGVEKVVSLELYAISLRDGSLNAIVSVYCKLPACPNLMVGSVAVLQSVLSTAHDQGVSNSCAGLCFV